MRRALPSAVLPALILAGGGSFADGPGEVKQFLDAGKFADAEARARTLVAGAEAAAGADSVEAAGAIDLLVLALYRGGKAESPETRALAERAVRIKEAKLEPGDPRLASSWNQLASILHATGDAAGALAGFRRVLAAREKAYGVESPRLAGALTNVASTLRDLGEHAGAKVHYQRALAILERDRGPDDLDLARLRDNFGLLLYQMGDQAAAGDLLEKALAARERALAAGHPEIASSLINLGSVFAARKDAAKARELLRRAAAILEQAGPAHERELASALNMLGWVEYDLGDPRDPARQALADYERALAIRERILGPDHPAVAWTLQNLGLLHARSGDAAQAEPLLSRSLAIRERAFGPDHPEGAESLAGLARLHAAAGRADLALDEALRAESIRAAYVRLTARVLPERQALRLRHGTERAAALDVALSCAADAGGGAAAARAWDALIRARSLILDEMASRRRWARDEGDPELARLEESVRAARTRLANLYVAGAGDGAADRHRKLLAEATRAKEEAERLLAERSAAFRRERERSTAGLAEVRAALPPGTALVGYARYLHHEKRAPEAAGPSAGGGSRPAYIAFVLRAGEAQPSAVRLQDASIALWRSLILRPGEEAECRAAGEALRKTYLDPLLGRLAGAERVLVVPDAELHRLPLAALPLGESGYVVESPFAIHYLPAERDVVTPAGAAPAGAGLLAIGNPAFDEAPGDAPAGGGAGPALAFRGARPECVDLRGIRFEPLNAAAIEVEEVGAVFASFGGGAGAEPALLLGGPAASEAAFKALAPGKRVLHLATHGFFLGGGCEMAAGTRGIGTIRERPAADRPAPARPADDENPLLLSGLALAGANRRAAAPADGEDGILTAEEVAALDLAGVECAVLSACDTGAGEFESGEGILGLRRAFQVAGARALVMSLWPVEDRSAREWMRTFYQARFARRLGTAEAAREASLAALRRRRAEGQSAHPFWWGAFVAAGEWR